MSEVPAAPPRVTTNKAHSGHRLHNSCDRCRSRKTKCIDPIPGPCRYCARTGAVCTIAAPRRKRPYYHVTEEEYQCSMRVLEHFFPGRELNLQSLRAIAKAIKDGNLAAPSLEQTDTLFEGSMTSPEDGGNIEHVEEQAVDELHESLGCMMMDVTGTYRYIASDSEIPFNAAVGTLGHQRRDPRIIPHLRVTEHSSNSSQSSGVNANVGEIFYLPSRHVCDAYIRRFLEDVHCVHWLYPVEDLLQRVEEMYCRPPLTAISSVSWRCSLYTIFAIGAANYYWAGSPPPGPGSPAALNLRTSEYYLNQAKDLIPMVYDEANTDSIRALALMGIIMENMACRNNAYLYIGTSVQMAYTLGLHRDQLSEAENDAQREQNRRIWWTLFMLDQDIAWGGTPNIIDERCTRVTTPMPTEKTLSPGLYTPLKWQEAAVSLCRLKRDIIQAVYVDRASTSISFSTISNSLLLLQKWYRKLPLQLKIDGAIPSPYQRAVSVLHLQYWTTTIQLTRPFLLYLVIKHSLLEPSKKMWFERMAKICIEAAQKGLVILQQMATDGKLSSLTAFDSTCILRFIMVFVLAYAHTRTPQYSIKIESLLVLVQGMEQIGWTKVVSEETPGRLADVGLPEKQQQKSMPNEEVSMQLSDEVIAQMWQNWDPNFITPLQTQQSLDLTFDDSGAFDTNLELMAFTDLDNTIVIDPSQPFPEYFHLPR